MAKENTSSKNRNLKYIGQLYQVLPRKSSRAKDRILPYIF